MQGAQPGQISVQLSEVTARLADRQSSCPDHRPWRRRVAGMAHSAFFGQPILMPHWVGSYIFVWRSKMSSPAPSLCRQEPETLERSELSKILVEPDASPLVKTCVH